MSKEANLNGLTVEVDLTDTETKSCNGYNPVNDRAKQIYDEIKRANETYQEKLRCLNETKLAAQVLQAEAFDALQKSATLNEQFYTNVNKQLLHEQEKLKAELKETKERLSNYMKKYRE